jgi:hypothetical protein
MFCKCKELREDIDRLGCNTSANYYEHLTNHYLLTDKLDALLSHLGLKLEVIEHAPREIKITEVK